MTDEEFDALMAEFSTSSPTLLNSTGWKPIRNGWQDEVEELTAQRLGQREHKRSGSPESE